ncbi:MAG: hypothetical protein KZQ88_17755, partial [Candidatus Thiodiazotropha sp. (ex Dulcina madagascariensis)]|nr:hypothetical protein [Candidatus Thiodiazotropha sp. (ex Dulcina madagascariensis)]
TRLADRHFRSEVQVVSSWLMVLPSAGAAIFPVQKILSHSPSQNQTRHENCVWLLIVVHQCTPNDLPSMA